MRVAQSLISARLIYFSGITLSLYSNNGIGRFLALLEAARQQGVKVAFDGNFRPRGWKGDLPAPALSSSRRSSASISRCRPSTTKLCCGATRHRKRRWRGCKPSASAKIVVKNGPNSALVAAGGVQEFVPVPEVMVPVDDNRRRRRLQCRLSRGAASGTEAGASRERRASARRRRHPPSGCAGSARRRCAALKQQTKDG